MKWMIGIGLPLALIVAMLINTYIIPNEHQVGDIVYYEIDGLLNEYYFPKNYTVGDWTYNDFIWVRVDGIFYGGFTNSDVDLSKYVYKDVTLFCSGCCYDDAIDKVKLN